MRNLMPGFGKQKYTTSDTPIYVALLGYPIQEIETET